jgi:hypothetical protein
MLQFGGRALSASVVAFSCSLLATAAIATPPKPGWGKSHHVGAWESPFHVNGHEPTTSGTWTALKNKFPGSSPETALLMVNGTVIVHDACTSQWYRLTPDAKGNYSTGTWSKIAAMPAGYAPLYYATQVLHNGNVIMNGGEYNTTSCNGVWTTLGAIYNAKKDTWLAVKPPTGWSTIGDAQSVVLQSGTYMLADCCNTNAALAKISKTLAVTWTATGTGKADDNDEEGWTLLPTGNVFAVDVWKSPRNPSPAELYNPASGSWSATATAPNVLADPSSFELGPATLLPNGTVFQVGTDPCAGTSCPSHSAIYNVSGATWTAGPDLPKVGTVYYTTEDAPAAVLPDGNVLVQMSPGYSCGSPFCSPSHFFEYDGTSWTQVSDPAQAPSDASYEGRLLPVPTGQILWTSDQGDIEVYTPQGSPNPAWLPTISSVPGTLTRGTKATLSGTQLTGVADGGKYGDDAQMAENYPIERVTNNSTGDVCFATTKKFSATSSTFVLPNSCETGASQIEVVVNGLSSTPSSVTVQ